MERVLFAFAVALLCVYGLFFVLHATQVIAYPLDVDEGEGFLLAQTRMWWKGESPYQPIETAPHIVANYTPLYSWAVTLPAAFGRIGFAWGRLISALSALGVAACIYGILWLRTKRVLWSAIGALLFPSFQQVYAWAPLYRVDMLGLLFVALGWYCYERRTRWIWPVLFWVLAFYTRQTYLVAPLAAAYSSWRNRRPRELGRILYGTYGAIAALFVLSVAVTKGQFFLHTVVYNANVYRWEDAFVYQRELWKLSAVFVALSLAFAAVCFRERRTDWLHVYLLLAWMTTLMAGKVGSAVNYVLEFVLAMAVATPEIARQIHGTLRAGRASLGVAVPSLLLLGALQLFHVPASPVLPGPLAFFSHRGRHDFAWTPGPYDMIHARELIERSRDIPGPVFSEFGGWAILSGHEIQYHPFVLRQLSPTPHWSEESLLKRIAARQFQAVVIQDWLDADAPRHQYRAGTERHSGDFYITLLDAGYRPVEDPALRIPMDALGRRYVIYRPLANSIIPPPSGPS